MIDRRGLIKGAVSIAASAALPGSAIAAVTSTVTSTSTAAAPITVSTMLKINQLLALAEAANNSSFARQFYFSILCEELIKTNNSTFSFWCMNQYSVERKIRFKNCPAWIEFDKKYRPANVGFEMILREIKAGKELYSEAFERIMTKSKENIKFKEISADLDKQWQERLDAIRKNKINAIARAIFMKQPHYEGKVWPFDNPETAKAYSNNRSADVEQALIYAEAAFDACEKFDNSRFADAKS